jgi:hypothetical protein
VCAQCDRLRTLRLRGKSFYKESRRSARRHSVALGISDRSVRRILHLDLNSNPYKMVTLQELSDRDMANRSTVAERVIGILFSWQTKHTSTYLAVSTKKMFAIGQSKIHRTSIKGLFTVHVWLTRSSKLQSHRPLFLWRRRWEVTSARYVETLRNFLKARIELTTIWFQQDGATAHRARDPPRSFGKCFWSTLFHYAPCFHGLHVRLASLLVIISFGGTSKRKCTTLDHGPSRTSRSQIWCKFQRYQKTWRGEHWEICEQGWKSAYAMMGNSLVMQCSKRNKHWRNEMYME